MSVVGFDLGNHSCVVCIAIERSIGWALNDDGKTETPAVVCFGDKQRFFGIAGTKLATENPENTITQIKRLIGRQFSDPVLQRDLTSLPFKVTKGADGFPLIHAQYLREPRTFTPTQVLAMLFSNLKGVASLNFSWSESMSFENMDDEVMDCCIGIPVCFTDLQRRAVLEAATIAGLNPLRLIHETTATALVYGSCKTDLPEKDPINVAFVDVGHSSLQVCIAAFKKAHLKVLAHTFDRNLGGRDLDEVLFQHFASKFKKEYKIDVFHNARACVKLRAACEKLKKVLSTRSEFFFTEVKDVTKEFTLSTMVKIKKALRANQEIWFIERQEFERMSLQLLERVKKPLEKALSEARLKVENIHAVEVVGSGSRVPAILKILTDFFGKEPLYTLTDCECVAKGCAVQSAFLRPSYKAEDYQDFQPFQVNESFPFPISLSWKGGTSNSPSEETTIVIPEGSPIPFLKAVTMLLHSGTSSIDVDVNYADVSKLQAPAKISSYTIGPFQSSNGVHTRLEVVVKLDVHGIVSIDSASLLEEEEDKVTDGTFVIDAKKKVKKTNVRISQPVFGGLSLDAQRAFEEESEMALRDRAIKETEYHKGELAGYVAEMKIYLPAYYYRFVAQTKCDEFYDKLEEVEEWLDGDGKDQTKSVYVAKLEELKKLGDPMEELYNENINIEMENIANQIFGVKDRFQTQDTTKRCEIGVGLTVTLQHQFVCHSVF